MFSSIIYYNSTILQDLPTFWLRSWERQLTGYFLVCTAETAYIKLTLLNKLESKGMIIAQMNPDNFNEDGSQKQINNMLICISWWGITWNIDNR